METYTASADQHSPGLVFLPLHALPLNDSPGGRKRRRLSHHLGGVHHLQQLSDDEHIGADFLVGSAGNTLAGSLATTLLPCLLRGGVCTAAIVNTRWQ